MRRVPPLCALLLSSFLILAVLGCPAAPSPAPEEQAGASEEQAGATDDFMAELAEWRQERDEGLRAEDGWLTLAGLYWLEEGDTRFGSGPGNDLVFPQGAPEEIGVLHREGDRVTVRLEPGAGVTHEGEPVTELALTADVQGEPTVLELGSFSFYVIQRGERVGIRLKDRESPVLAGFTGIESFPAAPAWRIRGRLEPYEPPEEIRIPDVLGGVSEVPSPGALVFAVDGESYRLDATGEPEGPYFVVFGDETNGHETYGGGRFLAVEGADEEGGVVVDFNRAYNPPCVFTPFATCPLPPRQNRLALRVEAGEKTYGHPAH